MQMMYSERDSGTAKLEKIKFKFKYKNIFYINIGKACKVFEFLPGEWVEPLLKW